MKDSLFEMLMNFFEKSLAELKEGNNTEPDEAEGDSTSEEQVLYIRAAKATAIRVFTDEEKMKLTKASYQFLSRILLWNIISSETIEMIINQLVFSESRFVTLQETKWTIRNTLAANLDSSQLAFLDLVLYQKEDALPLH